MDFGEFPRRRKGKAAYFRPAAGIRTDIESLLTGFKSRNSVRYEDFLNCWKQFKFSSINFGRQNDKECRQFTEQCLRVAVSYTEPQHSFNVRVFGLYAIYAFYCMHPFQPKAKIRVTIQDWRNLQSLVKVIRADQHLDAAYVFLRLKFEKAFYFVFLRSEVHISCRGGGSYIVCKDGIDFDADVEDNKNKLQMLRELPSSVSTIFNHNATDELAILQENYHRLKCEIAGPGEGHPSASIDVIDAALIQFLTGIVSAHEEWRRSRPRRRMVRRRRGDDDHQITDSDTMESDINQSSEDDLGDVRSRYNQGQLRRDIRARAFSAKGSSRRRGRCAAEGEAQGTRTKSGSRKGSGKPRGRKPKASVTGTTDHVLNERMRDPTNTDVTKVTLAKRRGRPRKNVDSTCVYVVDKADETTKSESDIKTEPEPRRKVSREKKSKENGVRHESKKRQEHENNEASEQNEQVIKTEENSKENEEKEVKNLRNKRENYQESRKGKGNEKKCDNKEKKGNKASEVKEKSKTDEESKRSSERMPSVKKSRTSRASREPEKRSEIKEKTEVSDRNTREKKRYKENKGTKTELKIADVASENVSRYCSNTEGGLVIDEGDLDRGLVIDEDGLVGELVIDEGSIIEIDEGSIEGGLVIDEGTMEGGLVIDDDGLVGELVIDEGSIEGELVIDEGITEEELVKNKKRKVTRGTRGEGVEESGMNKRKSEAEEKGLNKKRQAGKEQKNKLETPPVVSSVCGQKTVERKSKRVEKSDSEVSDINNNASQLKQASHSESLHQSQLRRERTLRNVSEQTHSSSSVQRRKAAQQSDSTDDVRVTRSLRNVK